MEPALFIALGALLASAVTVVLNLIKAFREHSDAEVERSAEYLRAKEEARRGDIQSAELIIAMYRQALNELRTEVDSLRARVDQLDRSNHELRQQNEELRRRVGGGFVD